MPYSHTNTKGRTYYLHSKEVTLRGGRKQTIYFFAKEVKMEHNRMQELPKGYEVVESERTGLPILRKAL